MANIAKGQTVSFRCLSSLEDGTSLDDPEDQSPFVMKAGATSKEAFRTAISNALIGMSINESKYLKIPPSLAFGQQDPAKLYKLPFEDGRNYEIGESIQLQITDDRGDRVVEGTVASLKNEYAEVDTNHPLAGKTICVKIQIIGFKN